MQAKELLGSISQENYSTGGSNPSQELTLCKEVIALSILSTVNKKWAWMAVLSKKPWHESNWHHYRR